jgi:hypothetical protein
MLRIYSMMVSLLETYQAWSLKSQSCEKDKTEEDSEDASDGDDGNEETFEPIVVAKGKQKAGKDMKAVKDMTTLGKVWRGNLQSIPDVDGLSVLQLRALYRTVMRQRWGM